AMAMSKRSPPAMPPAVLTITASSAPLRSPLGKRTRSDPASCTRTRRLTPEAATTVTATRPTARLPAKIPPCADPRTAFGLLAFASMGVTSAVVWPIGCGSSNRHRAAQRAFVEIVLAARIHDGAAVHDGEMIAEFAGEIEILLDQHDGDLA